MLSKLIKIQSKHNSLLCVGLDSNFDCLPSRFKKLKHPQFAFNKWVIDQTAKYVCAFKPNLAFYEARGSDGWLDLKMTMEYLSARWPAIFTIADAKRADIGSTNQGYVSAIFDQLNFDAITLHPYLGSEALKPFLDRKDKTCIILCRTSNPGAGELQDLILNSKKLQPLWQLVAQKVAKDWNKNHNCMLVVGATYPNELALVRQLVGNMDILVPGIGAQGGDLKKVLAVGLNKQGRGLIINSSRGIIFAENPKKAAKKLCLEINQHRNLT